MAFEVQTKVFNLNTSTGNQTFTFNDTSYTPNCALLMCIADETEDQLSSPDNILGIGACDDLGNQWSFMATDEDGQDPTDSVRRCEDTQCMRINLPGSGTTDFEISFVSFGAGTITVSIDNAPAGAYEIAITVYGGSDIAGKYKVGTFTSPQTGDDTNFALDTGIPLSALILAGTAQSPIANNANDMMFQIGLTDGTNQIVSYVVSDNSQTTSECRRIMRNDRTFLRMNPDGGQSGEMSITNFSGNIANFNVDDSFPGAHIGGYVALGGVNCQVDTVVSPDNGSTDTNRVVTTGFKSKWLMQTNVAHNAIQTSSATDIRFNMGMGIDSTQNTTWSGGGNSTNGRDTPSENSQTSGFQDQDEFYLKVNVGGTLVSKAHIEEFGLTDYTIRWTDDDSTNYLGVMAIGQKIKPERSYPRGANRGIKRGVI